MDEKNRHYHNKLVRDKIPEAIEADGGTYEIRTLGDEEFLSLIREKLVEEAEEVGNANNDELLNELADVLQLVLSIAEESGITPEELETARVSKEERVGAFKKKIFLLWSNKPKGTGVK